MHRINSMISSLVALPNLARPLFERGFANQTTIENENGTDGSGGFRLAGFELPADLKTSGPWKNYRWGGVDLPAGLVQKVALRVATREELKIVDAIDPSELEPQKRLSPESEIDDQIKRIRDLCHYLLLFRRALSWPVMSEELNKILASLNIYGSKLNMFREDTVDLRALKLKPCASLDEVNHFLRRLRVLIASPAFHEYRLCKDQRERMREEYREFLADLAQLGSEELPIPVEKMRAHTARFWGFNNTLLKIQDQVTAQEKKLADIWRRTARPAS